MAETGARGDGGAAGVGGRGADPGVEGVSEASGCEGVEAIGGVAPVVDGGVDVMGLSWAGDLVQSTRAECRRAASAVSSVPEGTGREA